MLRSLKKMLNYSVLTLEGEIGKAVDFYFDNKDWVIRYLVTALSGPGDGNAALIPPSALIDKPDWESGSFALNVGAEEVKKMPGLEKGKPLTRAHETVVHEYFSLPFYWLQNVFGGPAAPGIMTENPDEPDMPVEEEESHPHTQLHRHPQL